MLVIGCVFEVLLTVLMVCFVWVCLCLQLVFLIAWLLVLVSLLSVFWILWVNYVWVLVFELLFFWMIAF